MTSSNSIQFFLKRVIVKCNPFYLSWRRKHASEKNGHNLDFLFSFQVVSVIEEKDKEIAAMKQQLEASNAESESKEAEKLRQKLANLKEKTKAAEREKLDLSRKLKKAASDKEAVDQQLSEVEAKASGLASELKVAEEEAEKLRQELDRNLARAHDVSMYNELVVQVKEVTLEKERLAQEVQKRDELMETTTKEILQKTIRIESLENETKSSGVKLKCLESERQKNLADLARAQEFCLQMDRKIRELEKELSKHVAPEKTPTAKVGIDQAPAGSEARKPVVTLKIRKDLMP